MKLAWLTRPHEGDMSSHSVGEARNRLSQLIETALRGEPVVITRHGKPVVELVPVRPAPWPRAREALAWLKGNRIKPRGAAPLDVLLRQRDEGWP
jgi:prevent-host-death family protein